MKKRFLYLPVLLTFILGSYQGYIALFAEGDPNPKQVYPYRVTSLPPADQKALHDGIHVEGNQDLARLLEDYLS